MDPNQLILQFQAQDFDYWLDMMMDGVPDKIDKREGSIIYDALAPAATVMANLSLQQAQSLTQTFISTATDEGLDWHATDKGTVRQPATTAQVTAKFLDSDNNPINNVEVSDRFASIGDDPIFYTVTKVYGDGTGLLLAEIDGTRPNGYIGQILPVTPNDSLSWAEITEISVPARDTEDDEHLRERLLSPSSYIAYGGNVADYVDMMAKIDKIGAGQVYPSWQGGGTVKLVILDNDLEPASDELLGQVQESIDPTPQGSGYGLAPIDHIVTVVAPVKLTVDIASTLMLNPNITLDKVTPQVETAMANFFHGLREDWDTINQKLGRGYSMTIYRAQLLAEIMKIDGVTNATLPTLNGRAEDVVLRFDNQQSELPTVGEVTLDV